MTRLTKKLSKKAGLPPGALVHIGEKRTEKVKVTVWEYDEKSFQQKEIAGLKECLLPKDPPGITWIQVDGVHEVEVLEKLGVCQELHPLVLEDILNTEQRPKVEDYHEYLFIVAKNIFFEEKKGILTAEQISFVLRPGMVLTFQEGEGDFFSPILKRLQHEKSRVRKMGADYLAYSLLDLIVDQYFSVLEKLGERIEELEEDLLKDPIPRTMQRIQTLKREMILMRRWVWPFREVISGLERGDFPLIKESTTVYLRDLYDHIIQIMDTLEVFRDMLSGMVDIYLSSLSNKMNAVMKVLTIIATIFIPLTFIAGIYGMNFKNMPELEWSWGYPGVLILMAAIGGFMTYRFWKRKWL
jgi:magnesium transporter